MEVGVNLLASAKPGLFKDYLQRTKSTEGERWMV